MYRDMYKHKWTFVGTYKYTYMLRKIRGKEYEFSETQYLLFIHVYYYIFFWARCCAFLLYCFWGYVATYVFFDGADILESIGQI
jgi:hypothetical protein